MRTAERQKKVRKEDNKEEVRVPESIQASINPSLLCLLAYDKHATLQRFRTKSGPPPTTTKLRRSRRRSELMSWVVSPPVIHTYRHGDTAAQNKETTHEEAEEQA